MEVNGKAYPSMKDLRPAYQAKERIESIKERHTNDQEIRVALTNLKSEFIDAREAARKELIQIMKKGRCTLDSIERVMKQYTDEINIIDIEIVKHKGDQKERGEQVRNTFLQDKIKITKAQFVFLLKKFGDIGAVSDDCVKNASQIYNYQFTDPTKPCSQNNENKIDFETEWNNVRFIIEELFRPWIEGGVAWGDFFKKHCLRYGECKRPYNPRTADYEEKVSDDIRRMTDFVYHSILNLSISS